MHLVAMPRGKKLVLDGLIGIFQTQPFCKINGYYIKKKVFEGIVQPRKLMIGRFCFYILELKRLWFQVLKIFKIK